MPTFFCPALSKNTLCEWFSYLETVTIVFQDLRSNYHLMTTKTFLAGKITEISLEITILEFFLFVQEVKTKKIAMFLPPVIIFLYFRL